MKTVIDKITYCLFSLFLLFGFIFIGNNDILCIGEDGHIEIETVCLPSCSGNVDICILDESNDLHDEHEDCSNCIDFTLDEPLRVNRFTKIIFNQSTNLSSIYFANDTKILISTDKRNSQLDKFLLTFSRSPQSASIAITCLRC